jgi:hypothetical protein
MVSEKLNEYGSYGEAWPFVALLARTRPPGMVTPVLGALTGDAGVGNGAGKIDRKQPEIDAVHNRSVADNSCRRGVVTDLELIERLAVAAHDALQVEHGVAGVVGDVHLASAHTFELVAPSLIVEDPDVRRPTVAHLEIESRAERVLLHPLLGLQLRDVEERVRRLAGQDDPTGCEKPSAQRGNCRHRLRPGQVAGNRLD